MPLKDILKKKDKLAQQDDSKAYPNQSPSASEFTFMRTDTNTQEIIEPPTYAGDVQPAKSPPTSPPNKQRFNRFRKSSSASPKSPHSIPDKEAAGDHEKKRLSQRLHLSSRSRTSSTSSVNVPPDLPSIDGSYTEQQDLGETEAQWEARATLLASGVSDLSIQEQDTSSPAVATQPATHMTSNGHQPSTQLQRPRAPTRAASDAETDSTIQDAIRLHESGKLVEATNLFCKLAASGNVLSQVLYGLALRHGWGCEPDLPRAVTYLRAAASNSAAIESEALKAGMKKGGAAKGELVLAIFELANCFRHGWGVEVDKPAARQYYETAANLGDTDAMEQAAWCYLEGFGGKKDKVSLEQTFPLLSA
ncbi:MAG: hypothetical protein Q9160_004517 [Pyrenula sp. 1 TL-2023]